MIPASSLQFASAQQFPDEVLAATVQLLLSTRAWIWRRTERLRFIDTTTVEREIEIEFELPAWMPEVRPPARDDATSDQRMFIVPLGIFRRSLRLRNLRLTDEHGTRLTVLSKNENAKLAEGMFHLAWRIEVGESWPAPPKAARVFGDEPPTAGVEGLDKLLKSFPEHATVSRLLLGELWFGYLLLVALPVEPQQRRLVTVTHEERLISPAERRRRHSENWRKGELGLGEHEVGVDDAVLPGRRGRRGLAGEGRIKVPAAWWLPRMHVVVGHWSFGDVNSAHLEIETPPELEIRAAQTSWSRPPHVGSKPYLRFWAQGKTIWRTRPATDLGPRAHLSPVRSGTDWAEGCKAPAEKPDERPDSEPTRPTDRGCVAVTSVILATRAKQLRSAAIFLATLILALLAVLALAWDERSNLETLATILVFAPTLIATILARPDDHEISSRLTAPLRVQIAALGLLPVAAAVVIGLGAEPRIVRFAALILAAVALVQLGALLIQAVQDSPQPPATKAEINRHGRQGLTLTPAAVHVVETAEARRVPAVWLHGRVDNNGEPLTDSALAERVRQISARSSRSRNSRDAQESSHSEAQG